MNTECALISYNTGAYCSWSINRVPWDGSGPYCNKHYSSVINDSCKFYSQYRVTTKLLWWSEAEKGMKSRIGISISNYSIAKLLLLYNNYVVRWLLTLIVHYKPTTRPVYALCTQDHDAVSLVQGWIKDMLNTGVIWWSMSPSVATATT